MALAVRGRGAVTYRERDEVWQEPAPQRDLVLQRPSPLGRWLVLGLAALLGLLLVAVVALYRGTPASAAYSFASQPAVTPSPEPALLPLPAAPHVLLGGRGPAVHPAGFSGPPPGSPAPLPGT